jgi:hypothetical protein
LADRPDSVDDRCTGRVGHASRSICSALRGSSGSSELLGAADANKEGGIAPRFEQTFAEIASTDDKDTHGRHPW